MEQLVASGSAVAGEEEVRSIGIERATKDIFKRDGDGLFGKVFDIKKEAPGAREKEASKDQDDVTTQPHPYNMENVKNLTDSNEYHSTCIAIKSSSTVGIGFKTHEKTISPLKGLPKETPLPGTKNNRSKAEIALDELTDDTFQAILNMMCEDFWGIGNGYIEIVRGENDKIAGIYHIAGERVFVVTEDKGNFHYEVTGGSVTSGSITPKIYARFGDRKELVERLEDEKEEDIAELIHFKNHSSKSKWYGYADWLAAVPSIELNQMFTQYLFDFFLNRGVPEFMMFFIGQKLPKEDWDRIEKSLLAQIGITNSHKSAAFNFPSKEIEIIVERLGMDQDKANTFKDDSEATALKIVTAHKTPPLLAGIQISGKLGATNELPNALMAFQILTIGPAQKAITTTLNNTLGSKESNGDLELKPGDFEFKTITDELNLDMMNTISGMRQTVPEAQREGRNLNEGFRD